MTKEMVAEALGIARHIIPPLTRAGLIKPLGRPQRYCVKHYSRDLLARNFADVDWLDKVIAAIHRHWRNKNARKRAKQAGQKRQMPDAVERFVLDGRLPAVLGLVFFELHHLVHDKLPVAGGNLRVARGQIRAGDLQVHGGLLLRFAARMEQPQRRGAVSGVQAVLLARHVVVNVIPAAFFSFIESVSLSHNCVGSDEVTTVDLDSGREQVGVTQSRPELNFAGTSAGTRLWKLTKPYSSNWLGL